MPKAPPESKPAENPAEKTHDLVSELYRIGRALNESKEDQKSSANPRGVIADLRRGARTAPMVPPRVFKHVARFFPEEEKGSSGRHKVDAMLITACLFATHPSPPENRGENLGGTLRRVRAKRESDSIEKRFLAMLTAGPDELPNHLRHAVSLAKASDVKIDWHQLQRDIENLIGPVDYWRRRTTEHWARQFWQHESKGKNVEDSQAE
ncbi:MAG: type I-E CRISPR-associated protein Cse2/CasB [Candidatus Sumerlaeia bacterium]|nr:type I-E CRISPR-associated protein Cse2/CasB [Candidatus Sumerlaeia bacterium]